MKQKQNVYESLFYNYSTVFQSTVKNVFVAER